MLKACSQSGFLSIWPFERTYQYSLANGLPAARSASQSAMRIGGNAIWNDEFFACQIDEVRVYNRTLTQPEIQADMNQAL